MAEEGHLTLPPPPTATMTPVTGALTLTVILLAGTRTVSLPNHPDLVGLGPVGDVVKEDVGDASRGDAKGRRHALAGRNPNAVTVTADPSLGLAVLDR